MLEEAEAWLRIGGLKLEELIVGGIQRSRSRWMRDGVKAHGSKGLGKRGQKSRRITHGAALSTAARTSLSELLRARDSARMAFGSARQCMARPVSAARTSGDRSLSRSRPNSFRFVITMRNNVSSVPGDLIAARTRIARARILGSHAGSVACFAISGAASGG